MDNYFPTFCVYIIDIVCFVIQFPRHQSYPHSFPQFSPPILQLADHTKLLSGWRQRAYRHSVSLKIRDGIQRTA